MFLKCDKFLNSIQNCGGMFITIEIISLLIASSLPTVPLDLMNKAVLTLSITILSFGIIPFIIGLLCDKNELSNHYIDEKLTKPQKAYLIHCFQAKYTLHTITTFARTLFTAYIAYALFYQLPTLTEYVGLAYILMLLTITLTAFSFIDTLRDFLRLSAFFKPWALYKAYYNCPVLNQDPEDSEN